MAIDNSNSKDSEELIDKVFKLQSAEDKELLFERSSFITFVDPTAAALLKCFKCSGVPFEHFLSSCGHLYCQPCRKDLVKCVICNKVLEKNRHYLLDVELRVLALRARCSNYVHDCPHVSTILELPAHIRSCRNRPSPPSRVGQPYTIGASRDDRLMVEYANSTQNVRVAVEQTPLPAAQYPADDILFEETCSSSSSSSDEDDNYDDDDD